MEAPHSEKFIFEFNDDYTNLTYNKRVRDKSGKNLKITERLVCKEVESVSSSRNKQLLSESNGRITCIDFDGSQLGIPEVLEEVIHFSKNKKRSSNTFVTHHLHPFSLKLLPKSCRCACRCRSLSRCRTRLRPPRRPARPSPGSAPPRPSRSAITGPAASSRRLRIRIIWYSFTIF